MEKIININFQGRVISIEENAYNSLKQYTDSLRRHFASEESSDEIIHDIENRIAELLSDRLKRGAPCIGAADINAVIDSIGRLEDIEAAEGDESREGNSSTRPIDAPFTKDSFFRNADHKVIAGICSAIANRVGIDPVIIRVLFVLLCGLLFWLYILLWIIVPSKSVQYNITRRLYRNPDDKVLGGVCGGLATYFRVDTWIPRAIFALPFIISIISGGVHSFWWHGPWGFGPHIFTASLGSTLFITYIIFWIALPYASSATDKLEMRGEKIDMNSIKAATQAKAGAASSTHRGGGIGRAIGMLFKAFFLFVAGSMALGLFGALIGLFFAGIVAFPFTGFFLDGPAQYTLALTGIILFLGVPLLALITWIVRRLIGVRSRRHYLGYIFASLWVIGFICVVTLSAMLMSNFSAKSVVENMYPVNQPTIDKLYINVSDHKVHGVNRYHNNWFSDDDDNDMPFQLVNKDSLRLNTVKVNVEQSPDSMYHINQVLISRGNTSEDARNFAAHISFLINQQDSIISLPERFAISNKDKFRNQQVVIVVEVPVGKKIQFGRNIRDYEWFTVHVNGHRNFRMERNWDNNYSYRSNREYIMTPSGLMNTQDSSIAGAERYDDDDYR